MIQEGHNLRAGAFLIRAECSVPSAGGNAVFNGPCHRVGIVGAGSHVSEGISSAPFGGLAAVYFPQESDDLCSCAFIAGAEFFIVRTAGNAVFHCPAHGFFKIVARFHVGKAGICARRLRFARRLPQKGHRLRAGTRVVGAERRRAGAAGNIVLY